MPELAFAKPDKLKIWRVGFKPDPWARTGWEWATGGRFNGRWDDPKGNFRTIYAGSSLLACILEMLADFRVDRVAAADIDAVVVDAEDVEQHPTCAAGVVDSAWIELRDVGTAELSGRFCSITSRNTLSNLHSRFVQQARAPGPEDFDAAALKDRRARPLTEAVASYLYKSTDLDGVQFTSRHGDELELWAIFERPGDAAHALCIAFTN